MTVSPEQLDAKEHASPYEVAFRTIEQQAEVELITPQTAYELYYHFVESTQLDPSIYLSMSITSGGFARDTSLEFGQILEQNSIFGSKMKASLLEEFPSLTATDIILPSELGKVQGWSQSDFLLFWFHVIVGVSPEVARNISKKMSPVMQLPGFFDKTLPPDERWEDYKTFTETYVQIVMQHIDKQGTELAPHNMASMIAILDGDLSLGGRAEELLCRSLGIPVEWPVIKPESFKAHDTSAMSHALLGLGANALTITTLPYLPHYFEGAIISHGGQNYELPKRGGFRKVGLDTVVNRDVVQERVV